MDALTGQEVVSEISTRLRQRFSQTELAKIYKDKPVQSFVTPCAFIHSIETSHISDVGKYAWWYHLLDIRCHPSKTCTGVHSWGRQLGPIICDCIQQINISGQVVNSREVSWRVENDVLHVFVSYKYRVIRVSDDKGPTMETLLYDNKVIT